MTFRCVSGFAERPGEAVRAFRWRGVGGQVYVAHMRKIFALAPILVVLAACGHSGTSAAAASGDGYVSAQSVANAAGLDGCTPNTNTLASDATSCAGSDGSFTNVDWFKSAAAEAQWKKIADSMAVGGVILYGDRWAIECDSKPQCDDLQGRIGGTEG